MNHQSTRMRKLTCTSCGWSCRTTKKHIEAARQAETDGLICPIPVCAGDLQVAA